MARVAFIGLGHMGGGMAANLAKAGHDVRAFDLSQPALDRAKEHGCKIAKSAEDACKDADAVVTMLPAGKHVAEVYRNHVLDSRAQDGDPDGLLDDRRRHRQDRRKRSGGGGPDTWSTRRCRAGSPPPTRAL